MIGLNVIYDSLAGAASLDLICIASLEQGGWATSSKTCRHIEQARQLGERLALFVDRLDRPSQAVALAAAQPQRGRRHKQDGMVKRKKSSQKRGRFGSGSGRGIFSLLNRRARWSTGILGNDRSP